MGIIAIVGNPMLQGNLSELPISVAAVAAATINSDVEDTPAGVSLIVKSDPVSGDVVYVASTPEQLRHWGKYAGFGEELFAAHGRAGAAKTVGLVVCTPAALHAVTLTSDRPRGRRTPTGRRTPRAA